MTLCCVISARSQVPLIGKLAEYGGRPQAGTRIETLVMGDFAMGYLFFCCDFSYERHLDTRKNYTTERHFIVAGGCDTDVIV